jgi:hypothetical protein
MNNFEFSKRTITTTQLLCAKCQEDAIVMRIPQRIPTEPETYVVICVTDNVTELIPATDYDIDYKKVNGE